jgi:pyruvate formate lyase activating enzyme
MATFVKGLPQVASVELLPYHRLGVNKYEKLGLAYAIEAVPTPDAQHMHRLAEIFVKHGIDCIIG